MAASCLTLRVLVPSRTMSRGKHSTPFLLCVCALSFMVGSFLQQIPGLPQLNRGVSPLGFCSVFASGISYRPCNLQFSTKQGPATVPTVPRRQAEEKPMTAPVIADQANLTRSAQYATYDEALEASGMFTNSGPVVAGESGEGEQYTQPFQLLSWYPR